jgi:hypothetical protein
VNFGQSSAARKKRLHRVRFSGKFRTAMKLSFPGFAGTGAPLQGAFVFLGLGDFLL